MKQKILMISYKTLLILLLFLLGLTLLTFIQYLLQSLRINKKVLQNWVMNHAELLILLGILIILVIILRLCYQYWIKYQMKMKSIIIFQKWTINDLLVASLFTSLILVIQYLTLFLPRLPLGGSLQLKYLILFLVTYLTTFQKGVIIAITSTIASLIMIPKVVINLWQYLLDYFIPALAPSLIGLIRLDFKKRIIVKLKIFLITTIVFSIIYSSQVVSGYLYFSKYAWIGFSSWTYSLIYNGVGVLIFTYPITLGLLLLILKKTKSMKKDISY